MERIDKEKMRYLSVVFNTNIADLIRTSIRIFIKKHQNLLPQDEKAFKIRSKPPSSMRRRHSEKERALREGRPDPGLHGDEVDHDGGEVS